MARPAASGDNAVKRLPTTDVFRTYPIGMQWEWNHKPDNNAWSLFERPGWLRLKTSNVTTKLPQARNMLTQRIFAIKDKETTGTVRIDATHLTEGDRAGICILQDPYAMICVEMVDGKLQLFWEQDKVRDPGSNFTPASKTQTVELTDSIVYLRAGMKYGDNKAKFYYSFDNKTWKPLGQQTSQSFNLSVFVGSRFGIFCYATKKKGGYADFDWFTTEADFDEADIFPEDFTAPVENMYKVTKIALPANVKTIETMIGGKAIPVITATYADRHTAQVNSLVEFTPEEAGIVDFHNGQMIGLDQGSTNVSMAYTDVLGNKVEGSFTAKASYFPFDYQFVRNNIAGSGTYVKNATSSAFKFTTTNSQMGWVYDSNIDFTAYKYLVIRLSQKQLAEAQLNLYTTDKVTGPCCSTPLNFDESVTVVDLENALYTSKTNNGKPFDATRVRMVTLSGNVINKVVAVKEIFLSNDSQYAPTGIAEAVTATSQKVSVYTLAGQLLRSGVDRSRATIGLPAGVYVVGSKKVLVR